MRPNGFTLVELLVAITVMALLAVAVVLTLPPSGAGASDAAQRFAARVAGARDQAVLTGQPIGVWVSPSGYGFERLQEGAWQALEQKPFRQEDWGRDVQAAAAVRVRFDNAGLPDRAAEVTVAEAGRQATVRIAANGDVAVQ